MSQQSLTLKSAGLTDRSPKAVPLRPNGVHKRQRQKYPSKRVKQRELLLLNTVRKRPHLKPPVPPPQPFKLPLHRKGKSKLAPLQLLLRRRPHPPKRVRLPVLQRALRLHKLARAVTLP